MREMHDYYYKIGVKAASLDSMINTYKWLEKHHITESLNIVEFEKYILNQIMPKQSQEDSLQSFSLSECLYFGEKKSKELTMLAALNYLVTNKYFANVSKEDQLNFVLSIDPNMGQHAAESLVYGKVQSW